MAIPVKTITHPCGRNRIPCFPLEKNTPWFCPVLSFIQTQDSAEGDEVDVQSRRDPHHWCFSFKHEGGFCRRVINFWDVKQRGPPSLQDQLLCQLSQWCPRSKHLHSEMENEATHSSRCWMAPSSLDLHQRHGEEHQFSLKPTSCSTPSPSFEQRLHKTL